ncbi:hypothetical protein H5410_030989, partial [Solanum commersonii]
MHDKVYSFLFTPSSESDYDDDYYSESGSETDKPEIFVDDILSKQHVVILDTSFDDLKGEIEQLKQEIKSLKQNQIICDHRLTQIESINNKGKNIVEENTLAKSINIDPKQNMFLGMMQIVTAHK